MKKEYLLILIAIMAVMVVTGCSHETQGEHDEVVDQTEEKVVIDKRQTTIQHQLDAYKAISEKNGLGGYFTVDAEGEILDLAAFLKDLGLKYEVNEDTIVIVPNIEYDEESDFMYVIDYDHDIVRGDHRYQGRKGDIWQTSDKYESATDFIFRMELENKVYLIGCDELDIMYRSLRMYTTPDDKTAEVTAAIDQELAWNEG